MLTLQLLRTNNLVGGIAADLKSANCVSKKIGLLTGGMYLNILICVGNKILSRALMDFLSNNSPPVNSDMHFRVDGNGKPDAESQCEVILTDHLSLPKISKATAESSKVVLIDNGLEKDTVVSLFLTEKIAGVIPADSDAPLMFKAIQAVNKGEIWIDNYTVKSLLDRNLSRHSKDAQTLTDRETALLRLVKKGCSNKDIANSLSISENTVKSHLNRVFRKMHVSGRGELMSQLEGRDI